MLIAFKVMTYFMAAICLFTGANEFINGFIAFQDMGANLTEEGFADPLMNNVIRFFAAMWMGVGVMFIVFILDLERYKPAMLALFGIVFLGGIGRIISVLEFGMPEAASGVNLVVSGVIVEIVVIPVMACWLAFRFGQKAAD